MQKSLGKYEKTSEDLWANINDHAKICGPISLDAQRSKSKYQETCKYLLWANVRGRAKICCGQISADVQRYGKGKYQKTFEDLWANITIHAKISAHIVV